MKLWVLATGCDTSEIIEVVVLATLWASEAYRSSSTTGETGHAQ